MTNCVLPSSGNVINYVNFLPKLITSKVNILFISC